MQLNDYTIDEQALHLALEQVISSEMPDDLISWQMVGEDALSALLLSDANRITCGKVSHVPSISPGIQDAVAWTPLVLGCVNTIFQIVKEKRLIEKEKLLIQKETAGDSPDARTAKQIAVEQILRSELMASGFSRAKAAGVAAKLSQTIIQVVR